MSKMTLATEGDSHVIVTRHFAASPEAVYRAHIDPKLIQQWMLGPEGRTMPVCINDARPGGQIRYEWSNGKGQGFYSPANSSNSNLIAASFTWERMHLPGPTPDNHIETTFEGTVPAR